ncbi:MAG: type II secretion system F family protein [Candidatus Micrarchaeia archaeon]
MAKYVIEKRFSKFSKVRNTSRVAQLLAYAGIESNFEVWFGSRMLIAFLFGIVGALIPLSVFQFVTITGVPLFSDPSLPARLLASLLLGAIFAFITAGLMYMHLYYLIAERTKRVEEVLPDFLLMVAANMRSGMTPFAAFQAAARPEFGPLQTEINYVSSRSMGSESFEDALRELTQTIDSSMLRRVIEFIENEMRAGGKLAYLLETSAEEIREAEEAKNQMMVATKTYAIFVGFILVFGLPLLLVISTQFLLVFSKFQANISGDAGSGMQGSLSMLATKKLNIEPQFVDNMAFTLILGSTILSAILIGVIAEGKILYGLKYFPILAIASFAFFLICRTVIGGFVSSIA